MDSKIKMYEKAEEIQRLWKPQVGDWFYKLDGTGYGLWLICVISSETLWCSGERMNQPPFNGQLVQFTAPEYYIWLPHQNQLQEMVEGDKCDWFWNGIPHNAGWIYYKQFTSMEQLWLAFVMKQKYNKVWDWNVEKWIETERS